MTIAELNQLAPAQAVGEFTRCCGSSRWAAAMTDARPYASLDEMQMKGDAIWASLGVNDWREAFAAHPKIGQQGPVSSWSAAEQSGMQSAGDEAKAKLAALNAEYEARFGYIFIVCATGKSPTEMLAMLRWRMANDPERELLIAVEEQRRIMGLRLAKLVEAHE